MKRFVALILLLSVVALFGGCAPAKMPTVRSADNLQYFNKETNHPGSPAVKIYTVMGTGGLGGGDRKNLGKYVMA